MDPSPSSWKARIEKSKRKFGEQLYEGEYRGTFKTVSDKEHAKIVRLYVKEGLGLFGKSNLPDSRGYSIF
jgi:hypothetical protein